MRGMRPLTDKEVELISGTSSGKYEKRDSYHFTNTARTSRDKAAFNKILPLLFYLTLFYLCHFLEVSKASKASKFHMRPEKVSMKHIATCAEDRIHENHDIILAVCN